METINVEVVSNSISEIQSITTYLEKEILNFKSAMDEFSSAWNSQKAEQVKNNIDNIIADLEEINKVGDSAGAGDSEGGAAGAGLIQSVNNKINNLANKVLNTDNVTTQN